MGEAGKGPFGGLDGFREAVEEEGVAWSGGVGGGAGGGGVGAEGALGEGDGEGGVGGEVEGRVSFAPVSGGVHVRPSLQQVLLQSGTGRLT